MRKSRMVQYITSDYLAATDTAAILFRDLANRPHDLVIAGGTLGTAVAGLIDCTTKRARSVGRTTEEQPLDLKNATALNFPNAEAGISLQMASLSGEVWLSVHLDAKGAAALRHALAEWDALTRKPEQTH